MRSLVIGGFIGRAVEKLRLPSILARPEISSLLPAGLVRTVGHPLWVVKYHDRLAQLVCNWGSASRGTGVGTHKCVCSQAHFSRFADPEHGHVVTKDLNVVQCPELRELLRRGPGYRMRPVTSWKPSEGTRDTPRNRVKFMIEYALDEFAKKQQDANGFESLAFVPWSSEVMSVITETKSAGRRMLRMRSRAYADRL
jgi:hypothetical protein